MAIPDSERDRAPALLRRVRWPLGLAACWLVFAYLVAPFLIAGLYRGDLALPHAELAEEIAEARQEAPLAVHLAEWRWFALWPAVAAATWCWLSIAFAAPRRVARHVLGATPTSLAGLRIAACGTALVVLAGEHLPSLADLPPAMFDDMGFFELARAVPGFDRLLASGAALAALQGVTMALLAAALLGWRTRWTLPAGTLGFFLVGGALRSASRFFHLGLAPLYVLVILAFAPCADALSLDRRRRARRGEALPEPEAPRVVDGAARFAVWTALALVYLESGLSKLRDGGLLWWHPVNLRTVVYRDSLSPMAWDFDLGLAAAAAPDLVFAAAGFGALAVELLYPAVLVSAAARRWLPRAAAGLHLGILFVQNVAFLDLVLLQAVFYDWRRWLPGRRAAGERAAVSPAAAAASGALAADPARWARRLAAVFLVAWALRLELYPLSAMQMYADRETSGEVEYLRIAAVDAAGGRRPAPLEEVIPALADSRYRWVLDGLFEGDADERRLAADYLAAAARAYNRRIAADADDAEEEEEIVAFEVDKHRWSFLAAPGEAGEETPGERVGRVRVEVAAGAR
jgi:hypothetical protein